jgi:hypothetical protein
MTSCLEVLLQQMFLWAQPPQCSKKMLLAEH